MKVISCMNVKHFKNQQPMTLNQIQTYELCKSYISSIKTFKEKLPFNHQIFGCRSGCPKAEVEINEIHRKMHSKVIEIMNKAEDEVQSIINKL